MAHERRRASRPSRPSSGGASRNGARAGSFGIGKGGLDVKAALFWLLVGMPLAWGIWNTVEKALVLFR